MRALFRCFALLLLVGCPVFVKAVTIRIQDPNYDSITGSPTSFTFSICPSANSVGGPYLDHGVPITADGCFGGVNQTGEDISSIQLTFQNTAVVQNSGTNAASSDIFSSAAFTAPRDPSDPQDVYTFFFSGSDLVEGESFVITEDGVSDPSQFPTVVLTYTNVTPEPATFLLMGTGLAGVVGVSRRRRRCA